MTSGRSKRSPEREAQFLEVLAAGWSVTKAAEAIGIRRRTAYDWRDDEDFAAAWDSSVECGTDRLEDEAHRRAVEGTLRPVFHKGELCGHVQEFSDMLLVTMLRARRREKYSDRFEGTVSGTVKVVEVTSYANVEADE